MIEHLQLLFIIDYLKKKFHICCGESVSNLIKKVAKKLNQNGSNGEKYFITSDRCNFKE